MTTSDAQRTRAALLRGPVVVGTAGLSAASVLHVRDPHVAGSYGNCPFLALTGMPCPGCGGLRAVNDLSHGDMLGALGSNLLAVGMVGLAGVLWLVWVTRRSRGDDRPMLQVSERTLVLALVVVVAFGVARNTPWGAGLAP